MWNSLKQHCHYYGSLKGGFESLRWCHYRQSPKFLLGGRIEGDKNHYRRRHSDTSTCFDHRAWNCWHTYHLRCTIPYVFHRRLQWRFRAGFRDPASRAGEDQFIFSYLWKMVAARTTGVSTSLQPWHMGGWTAGRNQKQQQKQCQQGINNIAGHNWRHCSSDA